MTTIRSRMPTSPLPVSVPVIAAALLAVLIAWVLVRLLWLVISGPQVPPADALVLPTAQQAARGQHGSLQDLFGETNRPRQRPQTPAVESLDGWRLQGVLRSGQQALAILSDPGGEAQIYRIDEALDDERRLTDIKVNEVVIEQRGRLHRLALHENTTLAQPSAVPEATEGNGGTDAAPSMQGLGVASVATPAAVEHGLAQAQSLIIALPVRGGGFRVRPGRDASVFTALGLQTNDVVTAVNGQPVNSEVDWVALLMREDGISITLQRDGRQQVLTPDRDALIRSLQSP